MSASCSGLRTGVAIWILTAVLGVLFTLENAHCVRANTSTVTAPSDRRQGLAVLANGLFLAASNSTEGCTNLLGLLLGSTETSIPDVARLELQRTFNVTRDLLSIIESGRCGDRYVNRSARLGLAVADASRECNPTGALNVSCAASGLDMIWIELEPLASTIKVECSDAPAVHLADNILRSTPTALSAARVSRLPDSERAQLETVVCSANQLLSLYPLVLDVTWRGESTPRAQYESTLLREQMSALLCRLAFLEYENTTATSDGASTIKDGQLALSNCLQIQHTLSFLDSFTNTAAIPIAGVLQGGLRVLNAVYGLNTTSPTCNATAKNANMSASPSLNASLPSLCLSGACPYPLRATSNSDYWDSDLQQSLRSMHDAVRMAFANSALPFDGSLLPCGMDCVAVGVTDGQVLAVRIVFNILSMLAVTTVACSLAVVYFNRTVLLRLLVRRTLVLYSVCGGLASFCYTGSAISSASVLCHDDGTLRTRVPDGENIQCDVGAMAFNLFGMTAFGYFAALSHSWYLLMASLGQRSTSLPPISIDSFFRRYRLDIIYGCCALAVPVAIAIETGIRRSLRASVIYGACRANDWDSGELDLRLILLYCGSTTVLGLVFQSAGLRVLSKQQNGMTGVLVWLRHRGGGVPGIVRSRSSNGTITGQRPQGQEAAVAAEEDLAAKVVADRQRKSQRELNRLAFQIFYYCLWAVVTFIVTGCASVANAVKGPGFIARLNDGILCHVTSCDVTQCPAMPSRPLAVVLPSFLVYFLSLVYIASWPFTVKYLAKVPGIGSLPCIHRRLLIHRQSTRTSQLMMRQGTEQQLPESEI